MTILVIVVVEIVMPDGTWSVAEAKAKFSEVVERAQSDGPQHLTKNGKNAAVIISTREYEQLRQRNLVDVLTDPAIRVLEREEVDQLFSRSRETHDRRTPEF